MRLWRYGLTASIAGVWLVNGLYAKVLGGAPRHTDIVARVVGEAWAPELVTAIGLGEVGLALWIWGGRYPRTTAVVQVALVTTMNVLELLRARDLLMWGTLNFIFAMAFVGVVAYHGFWLGGRRGTSPP